MKPVRILAALLITLMALPVLAASDTSSTSIIDRIQEITLDNGLRIFVVEETSPRAGR